MSLTILWEIANEIRVATYYSLMADEVTDAFNCDQFVVCFRWVDKELEPHEEFVGLHVVNTIKSDMLGLHCGISKPGSCPNIHYYDWIQ